MYTNPEDLSFAPLSDDQLDALISEHHQYLEGAQ